MDKDKSEVVVSDEGDSTIDVSVNDISEIQETSIAYQTADEGNSSKYFSVIEDESTLENIGNSDLSLSIDKDVDVTSVREESSTTLPFESDTKSANLSNMGVDNLSKFNIHENIETTNILSGGVDMFDDNESSVDGHELVIDDDPQPSERSDDCVESGTEISIDMQYNETDDTIESNSNANKSLGFSMLPKTDNVIHIPEDKVLPDEENENDDSPKKIVDVKDFVDDSEELEIKSDNYNFPDGSHRVTLLIDGNNVEAINIGQDIYIYTDNNGELTAFQVLKDDGNVSIKYLHVGKNEDGNIEVYEEQVNQITVSPDDSDPKEKDISKLNIDDKLTTDTSKSEQKSPSEIEKNSQDLIKAVMGQEKSSHKLNLDSAFGSVSFSGLMNSTKIEQLQKCDSIELSDDSKLSGDSISFTNNSKVVERSPSKLTSTIDERSKLDGTNIEISQSDINVNDLESTPKPIENSDDTSMCLDNPKEDTLIVDGDDSSNNSNDKAEHSPLDKAHENNDHLSIIDEKNVVLETNVVMENDQKSLPDNEIITTEDSVFEQKESEDKLLIVDENNSNSSSISLKFEDSDGQQNVENDAAITNETMNDENSDSSNDKVSNKNLMDIVEGETIDDPQNDELALDDDKLTIDLPGEDLKTESNDTLKSFIQSTEHTEMNALVDVERTPEEDSILFEIDKKISEESMRLEKVPAKINDTVQSIVASTEVSISVTDEVSLSGENNLSKEDTEKLVCVKNEEISLIESADIKIEAENTTEHELPLPLSKDNIENDIEPLTQNSNKEDKVLSENEVMLSAAENSNKDDSEHKNEASAEENSLVIEEIFDAEETGLVLDVKSENNTVLISCDDVDESNEVEKNMVKQEIIALVSDNCILKSEDGIIASDALKSELNDEDMLKIEDPHNNDSQVSLESDDEFDEEYVEGEPVTGDSGIDWSDGNTLLSNKNTEDKNLQIVEVVIENNSPKTMSKLKSNEEPVSPAKISILNSMGLEETESSSPKKSMSFDKYNRSPNKAKDILILKSDKKSPSNKNISDDNKTILDNKGDFKSSVLTLSESKKLYTYTSPSKEKSLGQMSSKYNYNNLDDSEAVEPFKSFHPKSVLKTYSREVKPNLQSSKKSIVSNETSISAIKAITLGESTSYNSINTQDITLTNVVSKETDIHLVEEVSVLKTSPKHKSRPPRKQVFTSVGNSDIEIIFPDVDTFKNRNIDFSKPSKTYSRSKNKDSDFSNSHKHDDKKLSKKVQNVEKDPNVNSESKNPKINTTTVQSSDAHIDKIEPALNNSHLLNCSSDDAKNQSVSSSPLSNSAKRKRGRPKKVLSSNTNVFESVILNIDGSVGKPSIESRPVSHVISAVTVENTSVSPSTPEIVEDKPNSAHVKDKDENKQILKSPEETGKRKKGRPRKILSTSLNMSNDLTLPVNNPKRKSLSDLDKSDENMNEASSLSNFEKNAENVCHICSKNFRSSNVLLKHAKHCNGVINFDVIRSPKRKRVEPVKSDADAKKTKFDDESIMLEEADESENIIISSDITLSEILKESQEAEVLESIAEEESSTEVPADVIVEQKSPRVSVVEVDSDDHPNELLKIDNDASVVEVSDEITTSANVDQTKQNEEKVHSKPDKSKLTPVRVPKERSAKKPSTVGGKDSPMSRLSKFLNTKPPINKVIKCEICGKTFRQLAHMVYHRNKHDLEKSAVQSNVPEVIPPKIDDEAAPKTEPNTILKCDVCKKGFRKLHHLVEHREMHIHNEIKSRRTSVASVKSEPEGGFRCDSCDKSFRKLHHLVQHREMHLAEANDANLKPPAEVKYNNDQTEKDDTTCTGCGKSFRKRHHMVEHRDIHCSPSKKRNSDSEMSEHSVRLSFTSSTSEESNNCGICGKSYRKLHHMIEHRESHVETSVKPVENRNSARISMAADPLNTKDIIHECSKCYMVFPNVNSLNKHTENCLRKKIFRKLGVGPNANKSIPTNTNKARTKSESSVNENVNTNPKNAVARSHVVEKFQKPSTSKFMSSKTKSTTKISPVAAKKPKLDDQPPPVKDEQTKSRQKANADDDVVKYKINPAYKINRRHSQPIDTKSPSHLMSKVRPRRSDTALFKSKVPSARMLKTIIEDTTIRYSFPKTPKAKEEKVELRSPRSTAARRVNVPSTMSLNKNIVTKAKLNDRNAPTLTIKRKSLGGRKSLDGKKLTERTVLQSKLRSNINDNKKVPRDTTKMCKCDCGKQFLNDVLLKRHVDAEHTPPKSYKCQSCGVSVRTAVQFSKHKRMHEVESNSTSQSAANRAKKSARHQIGTLAKTPKTQQVKKKRTGTAHGGVPLSDKMRKAMAGSKF